MANEPACPMNDPGVARKWCDDSLSGFNPAKDEPERRTCLTNAVGSISTKHKVVAAHRLDDASGNGWWIYYILNGA